MRDDIPEAIRHSASDKDRAASPVAGLAFTGTLVVLLGIGALVWLRPGTPPKATPPLESSVRSSPSPVTSPTTTPAANATGTSATGDTTGTDVLLGHLAYPEAPQSELQPITADGQVKLRKTAAVAYEKMVAAAAAAGVRLAPLSGFRSKVEQNELFFRVKEERNQGVSKRAEVSAPPGRSEHHTGYALDIGDLDQPDTNLNQSFEQTVAFQWLTKNAAQYSFELSFDRDNSQGVSYEPWHWRYVGDQDSLETFYRAHNLKPDSPQQTP
jgi:zinc D-Ala-D-Ala carboxypeptidase